MTLNRLQTRRGMVDDAQPLWRRWLAVACLLVVGFASSAQAVHVHGEFLPHHETRASAAVDASQLPGSEASCLLCVAMHSAMPVSAVAPATEIVAEKRAVVVAAVDRLPDTAWHFAMFSRPPPAVEPSK
jgi:hypothetical protein